MSNEAPETREARAAALLEQWGGIWEAYRNVIGGGMVDLVDSWLTTAREQGRAEALADVTEGDVDAFQCGWRGALGDWRSVVKTGINHFLASRRRPVAAAGNEEIEGSGD